MPVACRFASAVARRRAWRVRRCSVAGGEEQDCDADGDDGGPDPLMNPRTVAVEAPPPEQAHDDEYAAVCSVGAPERGVLEGGDDAVGDQDDGAGEAVGPGRVVAKPAPHEVTAADLGKTGGNEQADCAYGSHARD